MKSGIYQIVNTVNGKRYIGSASKLGKRWGQHRYALKNGKHCNRHLLAAWRKYGDKNFVFKRLLVCATQNLVMYEQLCIDALKPEYNKRQQAHSNVGVKVSDKTKQKLREINTGKKLSAQTRLKMVGWQNAAGKHHISPEAREKMSAPHRGNTYRLGKKNSPEHRAKLKAAWIIRKERQCAF